LSTIAQYIAESLSEKELMLLSDFIGLTPPDDAEDLVTLRLIEPIDNRKIMILTNLGKEVLRRRSR